MCFLGRTYVVSNHKNMPIETKAGKENNATQTPNFVAHNDKDRILIIAIPGTCLLLISVVGIVQCKRKNSKNTKSTDSEVQTYNDVETVITLPNNEPAYINSQSIENKGYCNVSIHHYDHIDSLPRGVMIKEAEYETIGNLLRYIPTYNIDGQHNGYETPLDIKQPVYLGLE
uniref:Uncharacterized protein n=1 Tax=Ciona savignyi TaxID=51511 RepID=H2YLL7_CIOSA